jgi:putative oxidoreductase
MQFLLKSLFVIEFQLDHAFLFSGINKILNFDNTFQWVEGFNVPGFLLFPAVFIEIILPILIIIGYKTKIFTFFPMVTMIIAAFIVHLNDPLIGNKCDNKELPILYLVGFLIIFLMGPGKYSINKK